MTPIPAFASSVPLPRLPSRLPVSLPPPNPPRTRRVRPRARVSDSAPSYRRSALTVPSTERGFVTLPASPVAPAKPESEAERARRVGRYEVRVAEGPELYTVADIRCEAFYGSAADACYYPVRRREIYMAVRDRLLTGTRCLVVVDRQPPPEWRPFVNEEGGLVVGSLDMSLHDGEGTRRRFARVGGGTIYVSSMAVRKEWRRRGLAQGLLQEAEKVGKGLGVGEVFLHVEWENLAAVRVYAKCGFERAQGGAPGWLRFLARKEHTLMRKEL